VGKEAQLEKFGHFLAERGLRFTTQRRAVADVFFSGEKHVSLLELLAEAKSLQPGIGYATVYRTMRLLVDGGLAVEHKFGENQTRFEAYVHGDHHDHLICVDCGKIVEFEDDLIEQRQDRIAHDFGFTVVSHRHEIYVKCVADCDDKPALDAR
jgi:Fur family ferric uptake transcriptional regulator